MAYIDTSLLVAYYCPEPLSLRVQKALDKIDQPIISPLVEVELFSAMAAKVRAKELNATTARRILALFQKHLAEGFYGIVPVEAAEYCLARDWLGELTTPLRALDALHLAAASINDLSILTADRAMAKSARHFGVKHKIFA